MRTRSKARQRAVEALFEAEQRQVAVSQILERNPDVNDYGVEIARSAEINISRIDELVQTYSTDWPISRMPAVDRAIIRCAIAEMILKKDIDTAVIISEAMEIAQNLSTEDSKKFINGLLANISSIRESLSSL